MCFYFGAQCVANLRLLRDPSFVVELLSSRSVPDFKQLKGPQPAVDRACDLLLLTGSVPHGVVCRTHLLMQCGSALWTL